MFKPRLIHKLFISDATKKSEYLKLFKQTKKGKKKDLNYTAATEDNLESSSIGTINRNKVVAVLDLSINEITDIFDKFLRLENFVILE